LMASLLSVAISRSSEFAARRALAAIVESSDDAIIGTSVDGTVVSWNSGAEQVYGYSAREMLGKPIDIVVPPELRLELDRLTAAVDRGASISPFETEQIRKDGRRITVSLALSPSRDALGNIVGSAAIARDVTERIALEERLHQGEKMEAVGRLAGGIAHDFNNLLLAIQGYGSFLVAEADGNETQRRHAEQVVLAADRAAELTQQLLAYSRKQVLQPKLVDPNEVVAEIAKLLERMLGDDIALDCRFDRSVGAVLVDPSRLGQIVMNLGVNARDAMPGGGALSIRTSAVVVTAADTAGAGNAPPGRYLRLVVSDTGIGMNAETREQIFEPFFTTKPQGHGTGLGLSTVHGTVTQSGGYLTVESAPGAGTTFTVLLPACDEEAAVPASGAGPGAVTGTETVLVVEDQETVRELVSEMLGEVGYRVLTASGADEALGVTDPYDLVLTDVVMPGMSGVQLAARLRESHPELRVILTSGYASETVLGGLDPREARFLQKPFTSGELTAAVRAALDEAASALLVG